MKSIKIVKWLLLIAGIALIVQGVVLFTKPVESYVGLATFISISIIFSGLSDVINYFSKDRVFRSGWLLASGVISLLFGLMLLTSPDAFTTLLVAIPFIFAGWVIATGIVRAIGAVDLKRLNVQGWDWVMALSVINGLLGFVLMYAPSLVVRFIGVLIPFAFISLGINSVFMFFTMNRIGRFFRGR